MIELEISKINLFEIYNQAKGAITIPRIDGCVTLKSEQRPYIFSTEEIWYSF